MEPNISRRTASETDDEFLFDLYCSTRSTEVAQFGWQPEQVEAFMRMQFTMRQQAYRRQFPSADHSIILVGDTPSGGLIVDRSDKRISLTDIALLPQFQGKGIATCFIRKLQQEAADASKPLALKIDKANTRAFDLYKKLGFTINGESQLMYEMEWVSEAESI